MRQIMVTDGFNRAMRGLCGLFAAGVLALVIGCRGPKLRALGAEEQRAHGTAVFQAPREKVLAACAAALRTMGYRLVSERTEGGVIVTERERARTGAWWDGERRYGRSYTLQVTETPGQGVEVIATPLLFEVTRARAGLGFLKPREVPATTAWTLVEEQAEWKRLFENVRRLLDE